MANLLTKLKIRYLAENCKLQVSHLQVKPKLHNQNRVQEKNNFKTEMFNSNKLFCDFNLLISIFSFNQYNACAYSSIYTD